MRLLEMLPSFSKKLINYNSPCEFLPQGLAGSPDTAVVSLSRIQGDKGGPTSNVLNIECWRVCSFWSRTPS